MNPFALTRKLPDGRSAAGPLVYILIFVTILGLFAYYNFRSSGRSQPTTQVRPEVTAEVDRVSSAASRMAQPGVQSTPVSRITGDDTGAMDFMSQFDTTTQGDRRQPQEDGELQLMPLSSPTPPPVTLQSTPIPNLNMRNLRYVAPTPVPELVQRPDATPTPPPSGFATNHFLPRGALIPVYVLTTIKTGALEDLVMLGVAENVVFNHRIQLPFGTRLLGSASAAGDGDRIAVNVDTILFPNGEELPISGLGKDIDRGPGIRAYYIPQPMWVQLLPYVNNFIAAYLDTLQETYTATTTFNTTGGPVVTEQRQIDQFSPNTILASSASEALRNATQQTMESINQLYKPYLVIPPGTAAFVQLRQAVDITRAQVNGSANNPMPILPGFQNNPIPPSGLQENPGSEGPITAGPDFRPSGPLPMDPTNRDPIPDLRDPRLRQQIQDTNQQGVPLPTLPPIPTTLD